MCKECQGTYSSCASCTRKGHRLAEEVGRHPWICRFLKPIMSESISQCVCGLGKPHYTNLGWLVPKILSKLSHCHLLGKWLFFFFIGCTLSFRSSLGQGSNWCHRCDPRYRSDNARSLTQHTTRELLGNCFWMTYGCKLDRQHAIQEITISHPL